MIKVRVNGCDIEILCPYEIPDFSIPVVLLEPEPDGIDEKDKEKITEAIIKLINDYQIDLFRSCFVLKSRGILYDKFKVIRFTEAEIKFMRYFSLNDFRIKKLEWTVVGEHKDREKLISCLKELFKTTEVHFFVIFKEVCHGKGALGYK